MGPEKCVVKRLFWSTKSSISKKNGGYQINVFVNNNMVKIKGNTMIHHSIRFWHKHVYQ